MDHTETTAREAIPRIVSWIRQLGAEVRALVAWPCIVSSAVEEVMLDQFALSLNTDFRAYIGESGISIKCVTRRLGSGLFLTLGIEVSEKEAPTMVPALSDRIRSLVRSQSIEDLQHFAPRVLFDIR